MGKFEIYQDKSGKYRFRLIASNGMVLLKSQGYTTKAGAKKGTTSVRTSSTEDKGFIRKVAKNGKYYFTLKARNGEVIATSESYSSKSGMELGVKSVKRNIVELEK